MAVVNNSYTDKPSYETTTRKCRIKTCGKRLSRYNLNDFCFSHTAAGVEEKWKEDEKKRLAEYQVQKRYIEKKAKEKAKNKGGKNEKPKRTYRRRKKLQGEVS